MHVITKTALILAGSALPAFAAVYSGPNPGDWNTAANWDTNAVPGTSTGTDAVISNGATVNYPGAALGDLNVNAGAALTVSGGSTLQTDQSNWSQINNGTFTLEGGIFRRTATGNLVGSQVAGTAGLPTTSVITATNSSLEIGAPATAANLILGFTNFTAATLNLQDSTVTIGGELWLGSNTVGDGNQTAVLNINNSSITTGGAVGLWVWDYTAEGNSLSINFSGPAGSFIDVANSIGLRAAGLPANNAATWESLWDVGVLTAQGQSGLTGGAFSSFFVTTGTNIRDTPTPVPYRLTYIPEPSGSLLTAFAGTLLMARRRRVPA